MCPRCLPEGEVVVASFQFLNPLLNSYNGITFSLFRFRRFRYLATVLEMSSFDKSAVPSSNLPEKILKLSVPINDAKGSMVSGVPSAWLRWFDIPSITNFSICSSSSIVLSLSDLSFLISLHLIVPSTGISTVFKDALFLFIVTYFIVLHILITCSIF